MSSTKNPGIAGLAAAVLLSASSHSSATDTGAPIIAGLQASNTTRSLWFSPYPGASAYSIQSATNLGSVFAADPNFQLWYYYTTNLATNLVSGTNVISTNFQSFWEWRRTNATAPGGFYRVAVTPMSSNAVLSATVLNRLTYGPTPDEIARINLIGAEAYIAEQLAPWTLLEDVSGTHANIPLIESKFASATSFVGLTNATISDLRAWHVLRAVGAKRQFLEILLQFLENHFVTQWSKSANDYFDTFYDDGNLQNRLGAQFEQLENERWRNALLNPQCTFYDLLKISAESPAQIIYLDTVTSRSDGGRTANENYARELLELDCFGVDNGYDQTDITVQSPIWTGWRLEKVDFADAYNPFAIATTNIIPGSTNTSTTTKSNLYGVWAFKYMANFHNTATRTIFTNKYVPARFGTPWTTNKYGTNLVQGLYQIVIPGNAVNNTNGISEGYKFITHIANLPFTQEYLSIKLCRLLIHDDFPNPNNDPASPEYGFYNYAGGVLSPEAELVRACMLTWETNSPKGQIWKVLRTITDSDLFRTQSAAQQKVKTPLEFTVSAIRALRSSTNGSNLAGSFSSYTDGFGVVGTSPNPTLPPPLARMGQMLLFDRDAPDGYAEAGPPWISAGTLAERVRFVQSLCIANGQPGHSGTVNSTTNDASTSVCDIVGLLLAKTPGTTWTNAGAVADYFLGILYPGEGAGNLAFHRQAAINFLNDGSADSSPNTTPFSSLTVSRTATSSYDKRVRGMVGMLMTQQRFQEQ